MMTLQKKYLLLAGLTAAAAFCCAWYLNIPLISFSAPSGFYSEAFELTIDTRHAGSVYYTLDGSEPTRESIPYTGPIAIANASRQENVFSTIRDVSAGLLLDMVEKYSIQEPAAYILPQEPIDKCTIIRAAVFDRGGGVHGLDQRDLFCRHG